jgi:hypothetical protein
MPNIIHLSLLEEDVDRLIDILEKSNANGDEVPLVNILRAAKQFSIPTREEKAIPELTEFEWRLIQAAKPIRHCGDCGNLYWNPNTKTVWLTLGDGDGGPEYTDFDEIRAIFGCPGVEEIRIEAEDYPWYEDEAEFEPDMEAEYPIGGFDEEEWFKTTGWRDLGIVGTPKY